MTPPPSYCHHTLCVLFTTVILIFNHFTNLFSSLLLISATRLSSVRKDHVNLVLTHFHANHGTILTGGPITQGLNMAQGA